MSALTLSEIWVYPIKSLGGIQLTTAKVAPKGLQYDRRWMLVDSDNVFMTQRVHHKMALFRVEIANERIRVTRKDSGASISFPVDYQTGGSPFQAKIWDDTVEVVPVAHGTSDWFSQELGIPCKLVGFPEQHARPVDLKYSINNDHVSLADAYPFLIIGQRSLDELNRRLKDAVPMNRFRPNFVFHGGEPFDEDNWKEFVIGKNRFQAVKPCARCVLTTVDQETGEKGTEPLATLSTFRRKDNKVLFGQNVIATEFGQVTVGDVIRIA